MKDNSLSVILWKLVKVKHVLQEQTDKQQAVTNISLYNQTTAKACMTRISWKN